MSHDVYYEILRIGGENYSDEKVALFLNELEEGCNESVPDPWYGGEDGFVEVFDLIDKTCEAIVKKYAKEVNG